MLTPEQVEAVKNKNRSNIIAKMKAGRTLTKAELQVVAGEASGEGKLYSVLSLSQITGHERRKIMSILEAAKIEPAKVEGTTRYFRLEDLTRALAGAKHKITSERTALECEKLRVQIDRIQFQSKREQGQFWNSDDVRRKMIGNIQNAKRALLDLPDELAPAVAGLPVAEIHRRLTEGIDAAILLLQSGWVDGEAQHQPNDEPEIEQEAESEPE